MARAGGLLIIEGKERRNLDHEGIMRRVILTVVTYAIPTVTPLRDTCSKCRACGHWELLNRPLEG